MNLAEGGFGLAGGQSRPTHRRVLCVPFSEPLSTHEAMTMSEPILDFEALEAMTNPEEVKALEGPLEKLEKDTDILLFISSTCPSCPHQVRSVATLTLASPRIAVEIVDATQDPEFAAQYGVRAVPTTVVDDELIMVGVIPAPELALAHFWEGQAVETFGELWAQSTLERRMNLFLVAEEALKVEPECMDALVPILISGLEGEGTLSQDDTRRGDTADLLGQIGHPDARPILEILSKDANTEVAEAAEDALEDWPEG